MKALDLGSRVRGGRGDFNQFLVWGLGFGLSEGRLEEKCGPTNCLKGNCGAVTRSGAGQRGYGVSAIDHGHAVTVFIGGLEPGDKGDEVFSP